MEQEYKEGAYCKFFGAFAKIYTLSDKDGNVFYVGCTTKSITLRLAQHISEAKCNKSYANSKKNAAIRDIDYCVVAQIVDMRWVTGNKSNMLTKGARDLEKNWILKFHGMGYDLCNRFILRGVVKKPKSINETVGQIFESRNSGNSVVVIKESVSNAIETVNK